MGKICKYGCGSELTWNVGENFYANPDGTRHNCPNRNKPAQPKTEAPKPQFVRTKEAGYYEGIRKVAELAIADANAQLQDPKWEILKIVEKNIGTSPEHTTTVPTTMMGMITQIVYILGMRE